MQSAVKKPRVLTPEQLMLKKWEQDLMHIIEAGLSQIDPLLAMFTVQYYGAETTKSAKRTPPVSFFDPEADTIEKFVKFNTPIIGHALMEQHLSMAHEDPEKPVIVKTEDFLTDLEQGVNVTRGDEVLWRAQGYSENQITLMQRQKAALERLKSVAPDADNQHIFPVWAFQILTDGLLQRYCSDEAWGVMVSAHSRLILEKGCEKFTLRDIFIADNATRNIFVNLCAAKGNLSGDGMRKKSSGRRSQYYVAVKYANLYHGDLMMEALATLSRHTRPRQHPVMDAFYRARDKHIRDKVGDDWDALRMHLRKPKEFPKPSEQTVAGAWFARMNSIEEALPKFQLQTR